MLKFVFSKAKELWHDTVTLPKLEKLEYSITQDFYYSNHLVEDMQANLYMYGNLIENYQSVNEKLFNTDEDLENLLHMFSILPIRNKIKKLHTLKYYIDQSTFFEDFTYHSNNRRNFIINYLIIKYTESILADLPNEEKENIINYSNDLINNFRSYQDYQSNEQKIILKWRLDLELNSKKNNHLANNKKHMVKI